MAAKPQTISIPYSALRKYAARALAFLAGLPVVAALTAPAQAANIAPAPSNELHEHFKPHACNGFVDRVKDGGLTLYTCKEKLRKNPWIMSAQIDGAENGDFFYVQERSAHDRTVVIAGQGPLSAAEVRDTPSVQQQLAGYHLKIGRSGAMTYLGGHHAEWRFRNTGRRCMRLRKPMKYP